MLTDIADRLTPSAPIELTFGAQPVATGRKVTTIFGHRAASGGDGLDYQAIDIVNVGDPAAAQSEVDGHAGAGSQLGKMAAAFVKANAFAGRSNFPAFRIVIIPNAVSTFGPALEALAAVVHLRSDMFVTPYPLGAAANTDLLNTATQISGPDRDLQGQFGSFITEGSIDALATAISEAEAINSRFVIAAYLQDTNTALVSTTGDTVNLSPTLVNLLTTVGIYPGAAITGTGVPANTFVGAVRKTEVDMVDATGNPVNATASHATEALAFQNVVSQAPEIVAAAHAGAMMSSAFPYNPLQGVAIGGLVPPRKTADWIAPDPAGASESALVGGLSPLRIMPGSVVGFIRSRTTYSLTPSLVAVKSYFDWQDLVLMNDFREDCFQITQNPPFNNNPGGTKASATIASQLKDEVLREAQTYEDNGAFQNVKALAKFFEIAISTTSPGRFDFKIPVDVIPGLYVIAGNIEGTALGNFTL